MFNLNFFDQANNVLPKTPKPIIPIFFIKIILNAIKLNLYFNPRILKVKFEKSRHKLIKILFFRF